MKKRNKILLLFIVLVVITTVLYFNVICYYETLLTNPISISGPNLKLPFYFLMTFPVYFAEFDLYLASKSLVLDWSKRSWISKVVSIIACVLSVLTLFFMLFLILDVCYEIKVFDRIIYLVGIPISLEILSCIIRVFIFCIERIVRIIHKPRK